MATNTVATKEGATNTVATNTVPTKEGATKEGDFWKQVNRILLQALARPPNERDRFLADACGEDDSLRQEVDFLLATEPDAHLPIDQPVCELLNFPPDILKAGERVGAHRIEREIGRGGTGVVYRARRLDAGQPRTVAIKVLQRGMDTEELLRAFRQESRILANLDHPAIARFYDGGVTSDQRPFLVMEYVDGEPIDRYCETHLLGTRQRLRLFLRVCAAVQIAHQNLVIHRDLKPSNILVTTDGEPKLLDFGIAKVLHPDGDPAPTLTAVGWRLMTPGYASPEQVLDQPMTTASDVYSLGVVLYELLTGRRPYRIENSLEADARKVICRQRPLEPSLAAERHGSEASLGGRGRRLRRQLAGDLDNIVLMALRKRPQHRYSCVEQLADDLRRHLDGLPVSARKPTLAYRAGKFFRRHRKSAGLAAVLSLGLLGLGGHRALSQRRIDRQNERSQEISRFLSELFDIDAEDIQKPRNLLTVRDLLDRGTERIDRQLQGQPRLQADLMIVLSRGYRSLGLFDAAVPLARQALSLRQQIYGPVHHEVAEGLDLLTGLEVSRGRYWQAESLARRSLEVVRQLPGERDPAIIRARHTVAVTLMDQGRYLVAEPMLRGTLRDMRRLEGDESHAVAAMRGNLAILLYYQGDYQEALDLYRHALATSRKLYGEEHSQVSANKCNLATCLRDLGRYDAAERLYREVRANYRLELGREHPANAPVEHNLAILLLLRGELAEAEALLDEALSKGRRFMGENHPTYAHYRVTEARLLLAKGEAAAAEKVAREAFSTLRRTLSLEHLQSRYALSVLGASLAHQGRFQEAEPLLTESHRWLADRLSPRAVATQEALQRVVELYDGWGRAEQVLEYRPSL